MAQHDEQLLGTSVIIAKQSVNRLSRIGYVIPAMLSIVESTYLNGVFDTIEPLGLGAPDNAVGVSLGGAGVLTGTYAYYVVFLDNNRNVLGVASAQSSSVNPSSQQVVIDFTTITNEGSYPRATHFALYRNLNGGTTYFQVTTQTVATSSYNDNNSDATIAANDELQLDNALLAADTYGWGITHKAYAFAFGPYNGLGNTAYDDDFTWSKLRDPDNWPSINRTKIENGLHGHITAAASNGDDLVFYKRSAIYVLQFDTDPSGTTGDGYGKTINTERGCINPKTVINMQGTHFVMDERGIYEHGGGGNVAEIGKQFLERLWSRINWEQSPKFCAAYDDDIAVFFVALDRDTELKHAFVLDLKAWQRGREYRWAHYEFDFGIRDCARIEIGPDSTAKQFGMARKPAIAVITEYGYTGYLRAGFRDLVDPQLTAVGTVTGGSTSTIADTNATFTRTNEASDSVSVIGAYVRFRNWEEFAVDGPSSLDWQQAYRITGVSGTTLTVSPAMPSTPPTGAVFEIGGIAARYLSPKVSFGVPIAEKTLKRMIFEYQRLGVNQQAKVRWRRDGRGWDTIARTIDSSDESGIEQTIGRDYTAVNMGGSVAGGGIGVREVGGPGSPFNYIEFEVDLSGPDIPGIIDSFGLEIQ